MKRNPILILFLLAVLITASGCEENPRLVRLAAEAADRQAEQNETIARLQQEVATGSRQQIEEQAAARLAADVERQQLSQGFSDLEAERRQIAQQRRTESMLANLLPTAGLFLVVLLCVALAISMLRFSSGEAVDAELLDRLVEQADVQSQLPRASDNRSLLTSTNPLENNQP